MQLSVVINYSSFFFCCVDLDLYIHGGSDSSFVGSISQSTALSVQDVPTSVCTVCMKCSDLARLSRHTETSGLSLFSIRPQLLQYSGQYDLCHAQCSPSCQMSPTSRDSEHTAGLQRAYRQVKYADTSQTSQCDARTDKALLSDRLRRLRTGDAPSRRRSGSNGGYFDAGHTGYSTIPRLRPLPRIHDRRSMWHVGQTTPNGCAGAEMSCQNRIGRSAPLYEVSRRQII